MYRWLNIQHPHVYLSLWNILTVNKTVLQTEHRISFFHFRTIYIVRPFPYICSIDSIDKGPRISLFLKSDRSLGCQILSAFSGT